MDDGTQEETYEVVDGELQVTKPVTETFTLEDINQAIADIETSNASHQEAIAENNVNKELWQSRLEQMQ